MQLLLILTLQLGALAYMQYRFWRIDNPKKVGGKPKAIVLTDAMVEGILS